MSLSELTPAQKDDFAASLAVLALYDCDVEVTAENLSAALKASGNSVAEYIPKLYADLIGRGIKIDKLLAGPSAGGAVSSGKTTDAVAAAAAAPTEQPKEEEEEPSMEGAMNMFDDDDY